MTRRLLTAFGLAALAGTSAPARAGFQPVPIVLPAFEDTAASPVPAGGGSGLLLSQWAHGSATRYYGYRQLVSPRTAPFALPVEDAAGPILDVAVGDFDGDGRPDVLWERPGPLTLDSELEIAWGADPSVLQEFSPAFGYAQIGLLAFQLLPAPKPQVLASANSGPTYDPLVQSDVQFRDLSAARASGIFPNPGKAFVWGPRRVAADYGGRSRLHRLRLGLPGRPPELEDAFIPLHQAIRILRNMTPADATTLAQAVIVNDETGWLTAGDLPAARGEPGLVVPEGASCLGGAALDVDGDGLRDVVFTMALLTAPEGPRGQLLWVRNAGQATAFADAIWRSAMALPGLPAFESPLLLRELELPGGPAVAFHDAGLDEIVVLTREEGGGLRAERLPAHGATVHDIRAGDVVGETGPDLLASVVTAEGAQEVWVYPDDGALSPTLAWDPEPPEVALLGADLTLSVDAYDPDSPFTITWIRPPFPDESGTETSLVIPGGELCAADPVNVVVRALDGVGLFAELRETIPVAARPSLVLLGSDPPGRLVLAPGGVSGRAEGTAWPACGSAPSFTWDAPGVGMLVGVPGESGSNAWLDFTIPESTYEVILSTTVPGEPALTLTATEGTLTGTATLPLLLDARGLATASASFDRASLAAGELGFVRVQVASRLSVPLPGVRVRVRLDGLDFAGDVTVSGAPSSPGGQEGEVIVDPLPAGPAGVELIVPVRSAGAPGGASVELFSASGVRLSPEADPPGGDAAVPGCGCGTGAGGGWGVALALAVMLGRRRRPT